jgi:hypothetical protein
VVADAIATTSAKTRPIRREIEHMRRAVVLGSVTTAVGGVAAASVDIRLGLLASALILGWSQLAGL